MAKVKEIAKELVGSKVGDNGEVVKPNHIEKLSALENELKQIEAEYHKRVGKIEMLKELMNEG